MLDIYVARKIMKAEGMTKFDTCIRWSNKIKKIKNKRAGVQCLYSAKIPYFVFYLILIPLGRLHEYGERKSVRRACQVAGTREALWLRRDEETEIETHTRLRTQPELGISAA